MRHLFDNSWITGKPEVTGSNYCRERVNALHPCPEFLVQLGLENYTFLTPCVEITKANPYRGFHEIILGRLSNATVDSDVDTSVE